jgi:ferric-dicitrate binding protein FerR (iron transport regulator)
MRIGKKVVSALGAMTLGMTVLALANASGVGLIIRSTNASVDGTAVPEQGSVPPGSTLRTATSGSALVEFSLGTQVNLLENTSVSFRNEPGQLVAELSSGTLGAKSVGDETLIVRTRDLQIEPVNQGKAIYVVAMQPDNTAIVSARQGPVSITQRSTSKKHVLTEGHDAKVADAPQGQATQQPVGRPAKTGPTLWSNTVFLYALAVGSAVALSLTLEEIVADDEVEAPVSPSAP